MASRVNKSLRTSLDQERENFMKAQCLAVSKAVNEIETPVKAKHIRSIIIGTFQDKGCQTYWSIVLRVPMQSNAIIAWKFCHSLHKILREGHPNVLKDSLRHIDNIEEHGKLWGYLKDGYGKLISLYCRLLVAKIKFHQRNPKFPGSLMIPDGALEQACENDINTYFELPLELFDYMDEILNLQAAVFGSLDMSRSNSMTNAGQCRLAPLIPCIQDSSQVYDFIVKLLFKLHSCLPPGETEGHRTRFQEQFRRLRQFYIQSSNLQYFKTLIQIPILAENPPNFLISSELSRHVTPVVILPAEPPQQQAEQLIELDNADTTDRNESSSPDLLAERDRYIEQLLHQMEQLSTELLKTRHESQHQMGAMHKKVVDLENRLSEKETEVEEALKGKQDIENKLSEAAQSAQLGSVVQLQLQEMEKRTKGSEERFAKLKEVYQKLRDEHITLLRQKADADKKLVLSNTALEQSNKMTSELQDSVEQAKASLKEVSEEFSSHKVAESDKNQVVFTENGKLKETNQQLEKSVKELEEQFQSIQVQLASITESKKELAQKLEETSIVLQEKTKADEEQKKMIEQVEHAAKNNEEEFNTLKVSYEETLKNLTTSNTELQAQIRNLEQRNEESESKLAQLLEEKQLLVNDIEERDVQHSSVLASKTRGSLDLLRKIMVECSAKAEHYLDDCIIDLAKPPTASLSVQDETGVSAEGALSLLELLTRSLHSYLNDPTEENISGIIPLIFPFAQCVGYNFLQCHQLAHRLTDIEKADRLLEKCVTTGKSTIGLCKILQKDQLDAKELDSFSDQVRNALMELVSQAETLSCGLKSDANESNVGEELENELGDMERAIEEAAARIAQLWDRSKQTQTGIKLEVNDKVLDSCTSLMAAIIQLINKAKALQAEIVARGKGSASADEFYKKNHHWTEGLISAAKAVGFGAKLLTDAADKVVQGQAKFEHLTVASQEIAASTAQLVFASRVKSEKDSVNLKALSEASKTVSQATGGVVATAKLCAELVEDSTVLDFGNLTLHQAKRFEMESQIQVLEYESLLEKERVKLASLRKRHYQLAGETQ